jgi:hypothetical protein
VFVALITATLYITYNAALVSPPNTAVTSAAISTFTATSDIGLKMTIAITNLYRAQLSLFFGLDAGYPPLLGNPQPTILLNSLST